MDPATGFRWTPGWDQIGRKHSFRLLVTNRKLDERNRLLITPEYAVALDVGVEVVAPECRLELTTPAELVEVPLGGALSVRPEWRVTGCDADTARFVTENILLTFSATPGTPALADYTEEPGLVTPLAVEPATGEIAWTPPARHPAKKQTEPLRNDFAVTASATAAAPVAHLTATARPFTVRVWNDPPVLDGVTGLPAGFTRGGSTFFGEVQVGATLDLKVLAHDRPGEALTFHRIPDYTDPLLRDVDVGQDTGAVRWSPAAGHVGERRQAFGIVDPFGAVVPVAFVYTVVERKDVPPPAFSDVFPDPTPEPRPAPEPKPATPVIQVVAGRRVEKPTRPQDATFIRVWIDTKYDDPANPYCKKWFRPTSASGDTLHTAVFAGLNYAADAKLPAIRTGSSGLDPLANLAAEFARDVAVERARRVFDRQHPLVTVTGAGWPQWEYEERDPPPPAGTPARPVSGCKAAPPPDPPPDYCNVYGLYLGVCHAAPEGEAKKVPEATQRKWLPGVLPEVRKLFQQAQKNFTAVKDRIKEEAAGALVRIKGDWSPTDGFQAVERHSAAKGGPVRPEADSYGFQVVGEDPPSPAAGDYTLVYAAAPHPSRASGSAALGKGDVVRVAEAAVSGDTSRPAGRPPRCSPNRGT